MARLRFSKPIDFNENELSNEQEKKTTKKVQPSLNFMNNKWSTIFPSLILLLRTIVAIVVNISQNAFFWLLVLSDTHLTRVLGIGFLENIPFE